MIEHLYTKDYGHHAISDLGLLTWETEMRLHIEVYILADKYNIVRLPSLSASNIRTVARTQRGGLPKIIREVYQKTIIDNGIRGVLADVAAEHAKWLFMEVGQDFGKVGIAA